MIFIDTGAFLARYIARDQHHRKAARAWKRLAKREVGGVTSNFVLDETFTLLGRWVGHEFAAARARAVLDSEVVEILRPEARDELMAVDLFEKYADQKVSFTDCVSFALMQRHEIERAFSFDRHFRAAGFRLWPA